MNNIKRFATLALGLVMLLSILTPTASASGIPKESDIIWVKYDEVGFIGEDLLKGSRDGLWGIISIAGKEIVAPKYKEVFPFENGLALVMIQDITYHYRYGFRDATYQNKYGFIDKTGKEVIPVKYHNIPQFNHGVAPAMIDNKWVLLNKSGQEIKLDYDYDYVYPFKDGVARVIKDRYPDMKIGYIDTNGNEILPLSYSAGEDFSEGFAAVKMDNNGKYGYIDKTGRVVIPFELDYPQPFKDGFAQVSNHQKHGYKTYYIDKTGKEFFVDKYDSFLYLGRGLMMVSKGQYAAIRYGVIDKNGKEIIPLKYIEIRLGEEGNDGIYVRQHYTEGGLTGLYSLSGKLIIPPTYFSLSPIKDGLLSVMNTDERRDYCGFIDATGKVVIPLKYDFAGNFEDGLAVVGRGQYGYATYGFIDKTGKEIVPVKYAAASHLNNGYFAIGTKTKVSDYGDYRYTYGMVDKTGKFVLPIKYSYISELGEYHVLITNQINDHETRYGILRTSSKVSEAPVETSKKDMAKVTASKVLVDGKFKSFEAYTIGGYNYFKLRDIAMVLNGTSKQFEVVWDAKANAVNLITNKTYTPVGGELVMPNSLKDSNAQVTTSRILLNGKEVVLEVYVINNNNYFKLRDLGEKLNFKVDYDAATKNIIIESK